MRRAPSAEFFWRSGKNDQKLKPPRGEIERRDERLRRAEEVVVEKGGGGGGGRGGG